MNSSTRAESSPFSRSLAHLWSQIARALSACHLEKRAKRLRLCESVSLGDKRLVAVIEYEGRTFLVGGGPQSVTLLTRLGESLDFPEVLTEWSERQR